MKDFDGKVAVVIGGASGIGLGISRGFATRGMKLVIADLDEQSLETLVDEFTARGVDAVGQVCDVSNLTAVEALADKALEKFGAVHIACNSAGVGIPTSLRNIKLKDWRWIVDVNLWGPIYGQMMGA